MRVLLHDPSRWPAQRAALEEVRSITTFPALIEVLKRTSHAFDLEEENQFEGGAFAGVGALAESVFEKQEEWWSLISYIADLALRSVALFEAQPLQFLAPGVSGHATLSRLQAASLNALALFNALPYAPPNSDWEMPEHLSFRHWLSGAVAGYADSHKARCLLQYFLRIRHQEGAKDSGDGTGVTISRLVLSAERKAAVNAAADWLACATPLQPLVVESSPSVGIEDAKGALQADFANEYIGGGVMIGGTLQEEIRFSTCPECLVANLLCPKMQDHEAILLSGVRQYARFTGYGDGFECIGAHPDPDASIATVLAIDARAYMGDDRRRQYASSEMLRELTKLWVGVSGEGWPEAAAAAVAANRGRGVGAKGAATFGERPRARQEAAATASRSGGGRGAESRRGGKSGSSSGAGRSVAFATGQPFATGNWGCGCFGGDLQLKALLQWMAASRAGRAMIYYPFGDSRAAGLEEVSARLLAAKTTVGQLGKLLFNAPEEALRDRGAFALVLAAVSA